MPASFADSNILLYLAVEGDPRFETAWTVLDEQPVISVQVLNEVASVMRGKWRRSWDDTDRLLTLIRVRSVVRGMDQLTHDLGIEIAKNYKLHIYDSMIVAAALISGCETLYTEDMQHGLVVEDQLRLVNPFG